jgi:hypothetical protein
MAQLKPTSDTRDLPQWIASVQTSLRDRRALNWEIT